MYPLCETDYFARLDLICAKCGQALRSSYITACGESFYTDSSLSMLICQARNITSSTLRAQSAIHCSDPMTRTTSIAGKSVSVSHIIACSASGSRLNRPDCHFHYSTKFAVKCVGCETAILKQFVEMNRNGRDECWHPECYMISKVCEQSFVSNMILMTSFGTSDWRPRTSIPLPIPPSTRQSHCWRSPQRTHLPTASSRQVQLAICQSLPPSSRIGRKRWRSKSSRSGTSCRDTKRARPLSLGKCCEL